MLSVKNLNWLSSKQALADLSRFVVEMQEEHNLTGKWIALGNHLLYINRDTERTRTHYHIDTERIRTHYHIDTGRTRTHYLT